MVRTVLPEKPWRGGAPKFDVFQLGSKKRGLKGEGSSCSPPQGADVREKKPEVSLSFGGRKEGGGAITRPKNSLRKKLRDQGVFRGGRAAALPSLKRKRKD